MPGGVLKSSRPKKGITFFLPFWIVIQLKQSEKDYAKCAEQ